MMRIWRVWKTDGQMGVYGTALVAIKQESQTLAAWRANTSRRWPATQPTYSCSQKRSSPVAGWSGGYLSLETSRLGAFQIVWQARGLLTRLDRVRPCLRYDRCFTRDTVWGPGHKTPHSAPPSVSVWPWSPRFLLGLSLQVIFSGAINCTAYAQICLRFSEVIWFGADLCPKNYVPR